MIETTGKWGFQIPGVGLEILDFADQGDMEYTPGIFSILNRASGTVGKKNFEGKTGFSSIQEFPEGDAIPTVSRDKTYLTEITYNNYGGSVQMTQNLLDDNNYQSQLDAMKDLTRNTNYFQDKSGLQLFNGGFATTKSVNSVTLTWYGDAVPQFSTVHPTQSSFGATQSNASATGIKLTHDNYFTARLAIDKQETDNGNAVTMAGKKQLIIPLDIEKKAKETLDSELTPESANNAINVYRGTTDLIMSKFLNSEQGGSASAWFVTVAGENMLYQDIRQEKRLDQDYDILTRTHTFTVDARWANYSRGWLGTWGSEGALAAYSS